MDEEVFLFLLVMVATGVGGYMLGKLRTAKAFLEKYVEQGRAGSAQIQEAPRSHDLERVRAAIESLGHRFDLMEQRVDFTERLLDATQRKAVPRPEEEWTNRRV